MNDQSITRRTLLGVGATIGGACISVGAFAQEGLPATKPAPVPERASYEWWENVHYGYWEVIRGSAFAPCAVTHSTDEDGLDYREGSHPWHNVLLGKQFDHPSFIDPAAYLVGPIKPAVVPPVYTLRRADSKLLNIGYSIGGRFFAWVGVRVDPAALAPGAEKKLKDNAGEWAGGRRTTDPTPMSFGIPTPPNEVEFWLSLHTSERTREFQRHWQENPVDRPLIGPHISLRPPGEPRFFEREKED